MILENKLDEGSKAEFVGQIVDVFEDYLCEHGIALENEDRDAAIEEGEVEEDEAAIIYGDAYDFISIPVETSIEGYGLMKGEVLSESDLTLVLEDIMAGFNDTLVEGRYEGRIPETDLNDLKDKVQEKFEKWNLCDAKEKEHDM